MLTIWNIKTQNYKFVDLIKGYNFDIKCIFIWHHTQQRYYFLMRQKLIRDYYAAKILYYFFHILTTSIVKIKKL
jgi:hypothetical protein